MQMNFSSSLTSWDRGMRERSHLRCHLHHREGSGHAAARASVSPAEPQICGATAHCWGLKDCILRAQLPSPAPLTLNPFWGPKCSRQWWGHPELLCTPKPWERAGAQSTLLFQPAPIPALHLSHLAEQISGRFLLIPRSQPGVGSCSKQGGRHPKVSSPQCCPQTPRHTNTAAIARRCHTGDRRDS